MRPQSSTSRQQFVRICECGCGQPTLIADKSDSRIGWTRGQPLRFIHRHNPRKYQGVPYLVNESGCWVWQWARDERGYGLDYQHGNRKVYAHILIYEQHRGPVPEGMELDHTCRNPPCVNPDHLDPVPHMVNVQRGGRAKLTPAQVATIRARVDAGAPRLLLAREYEISYDAVRQIALRLTWKNVA
jgi:hypothetical protein